jgi:hypothetical protein
MGELLEHSSVRSVPSLGVQKLCDCRLDRNHSLLTFGLLLPLGWRYAEAALETSHKQTVVAKPGLFGNRDCGHTWLPQQTSRLQQAQFQPQRDQGIPKMRLHQPAELRLAAAQFMGQLLWRSIQ